MDIDLRLVLALIGIIIIALIVWDAYRKKSIAAQKAAEFNQDALDEMMQTRDGSGYDITGVSQPRTIDSDDDFEIESMVAVRDEEMVFEDDVLTDDSQLDLNIETESTQSKNEQSKQNQPISAEPELIISINNVAKNNSEFEADKLLHCMLSRGLRFGDLNIFHRHKNTSGEGPVQFSLANALKPGTFDLDDMTSFQTKGVSLFMTLPGPEKPSKAYQIMLDTAQHLASELNGQLLDSSRNNLTQQSIQHLSDKVQDFERRNIKSN